MQRADFQANNCVQTELRELKASQCWVVKPSSCCRWTHWMQLGAKTEEQLGTNAVLEPGVKDTEPPLPWVWIYHAFSLGECNLHPDYTSPLSTSHQSWHPMSTAFRNRMWDTRDAVPVLFITVIPVYRKAHLDAVPGFQWRSWVFGFFTQLLNWVDKESMWFCPRVLHEFLESTTTQWQEAAGSPLYLFSKDWISSLFSPQCQLSRSSTNTLPTATGNSCISVG